ncbi:hypothetical protein J4447_00130 [Candidatus Pacearchaeota archaeon]|nr:hypothetical protein [Candidatus Pacearchaeota archaeon]
MKNRRGFELLSGKTIGVLIAILCIVILLYLGSELAIVRGQYEQRKKAEGMMQEVVASIYSLKEIGSEKNYLVSSVKEWNFVVFREMDARSPPSCQSKKCLCLCPEEDAISCYNYGVCKAPLNVILKDNGEDVRALEVSAPTKDADIRKSEIIIKKVSSESYEIGYALDKKAEERAEA